MKKNKLMAIIGTIMGAILLVAIVFYIYILFSAKKLDNGYNYDKLKEEINNNTIIKYDELPKNLINAVISEIDYDNQLLDGIGKWYTKISYLILRDNNVVNFYDDVPLKSLKLAYLSSHTIEKDFTKEELIAYYINVTNFGMDSNKEAIYGIKSAAKNYFNKDVNELSLSECATLAGIIESPSKYNLYNNYNETVEKRNQVLKEMYSAGYITKEEKETAENTKLAINGMSELYDYKQYTVKLKDKSETYDFDKLHLEFTGTTYKTDDGNYNYVLNIKYDGKEINNIFFNDKENYRIWSENMASQFNIYKVYDVYILDSFIAKQCFDHEIMIFNTKGEVIKTFTNCDFSIEENQIKIEISDNGQCMGSGWDEHIAKYEFTISNDTIKNIN